LTLLVSVDAFAAPRAEELMLAGRLREALPAAKAEANAAPTDVDAQERYIDVLLTLGLPQIAADTYRARLAAAPGDADLHYLVGRSVPTAEDASEAYERALRIDPDHARSHMGMGAVHRSLDDLEDAEVAYRRAVGLDPGLSEAWAGLGVTLVSQGRWEEALAAARNGMKYAPDEADAYLAVAVLAPAETEAVIARAVVAAPLDPRVHAAQAELLLERGDGAGARRSVDRALAIDPSQPDALLMAMFADAQVAQTLDAAGYRALVANQRRESEDPAAALDAYDGLIGQYPHCPLPFMSRARVRSGLGDGAGARSDLEKALALDPGNVEAQGAFGLLLYTQGRSAEARPWLDEASRKRPDDASLCMAAAMAAADSGDGRGAMQRMATASDRWPYDTRVALTRAQILSRNGELETAYLVLREALARAPEIRVALALAAAARDTGRFGEAASILEEMGRLMGDARFAEVASRLRAQGAPSP
jgi:tetratricopeptide (TPR) repeat protein